jgi:hypothetical protein
MSRQLPTDPADSTRLPNESSITSDQLRQMIRDELGQSDSPDMWDVTRKVVARLAPTQYVDALEITMRVYVRETVRTDRNVVMGATVEPESYAEHVAHKYPNGRSRRSIAGDAAWRRKLDVLVTPYPGVNPKSYWSCTQQDMAALVASYARRENENAEKKLWHARVLRAMQAANAETVADMPEDIIRPLIEKVAA